MCRRPSYEIQYEQVGEHTFVHVIVHRWTAGAKIAFEQNCNALQLLLNGPVYVLCPLSDKKLLKFCTQFGFEPALNTVTAEGEPAVILIRNKKTWAKASSAVAPQR